MKTDIEISYATPLQPIEEIAAKAGINADKLECYGPYMAKVKLDVIDKQKAAKSHLVLVTAMSPTKAGIGKTTVSIGLSMGLCRLGKRSVLALREPSLGPCFGMKGGATGGGYSQVVPMEKINLHFTGDFHAITSANNMIAALLDNYVYQHRSEGFFLSDQTWRRVLDVNDRNLRDVVTGLGARTNGCVNETGFDITPASEIMAVLCLAKSEEDLRQRLDNIVLGVDSEGKPFTLKQMGVTGAIMVLLHDALKPNLVQTVEHTPAFVHGGPFANIAHGCNSILATQMALSCGDYAVTEAGFGADLGAEKFLDIKCRQAGLHPEACVLVCTMAGLKQQGGGEGSETGAESAAVLEKGFANLDRHISNLQHMGQHVIVTLNRFERDTAEEIAQVRSHCEQMGVAFAANEAFMKGGEGCLELAQAVVDMVEKNPAEAVDFTYNESDSLEDKIEKVCRKVYGASAVEFKPAARRAIDKIREWGYDKLPVCIAKTQYSFTDDAKVLGAPSNFTITVRDIALNAGAGMIVAIAGTILRMPGLPKHPQAERLDVVDGRIVGLQ